MSTLKLEVTHNPVFIYNCESVETSPEPVATAKDVCVVLSANTFTIEISCVVVLLNASVSLLCRNKTYKKLLQCMSKVFRAMRIG